ncbi:MAG: hypothetical protein AAB410_01835 [Patescibacteria group bacterium]
MEIEHLFYGTPVRLNLLALLVIFSALEKKEVGFLFIAFFCGLLLDFYSSGPFGSFLFSFLFTASLLNWSIKTFWAAELNFKSIFLFLSVGLLAVEIFLRIFAKILPHAAFSDVIEFNPVILRIIFSIIFGLFASFPVFALWRFALKIIIGMETKRLALK